MKTQNHTPLPWKYRKSKLNDFILIGQPPKNLSKIGFSGHEVGRIDNHYDAEVIVRAVNNHERILEACKESLRFLNSIGYQGGDIVDGLIEAIKQAEA